MHQKEPDGMPELRLFLSAIEYEYAMLAYYESLRSNNKRLNKRKIRTPLTFEDT